jgi:hypothetical protein
MEKKLKEILAKHIFIENESTTYYDYEMEAMKEACNLAIKAALQWSKDNIHISLETDEKWLEDIISGKKEINIKL